MTTTPISASCPICGTESLVPADALLVSVALGAQGSESDAEELSRAILTDAASVAWTCPTCQDLARVIIGWPMLLTLASAGVQLLDDGGAAMTIQGDQR